MEWVSNFSVWSIAIFFLPPILLHLFRRRRNSVHHQRRCLPPGPPGWPIFGNMFDLGTMPHRTLAGLRPKYGDIVWLNLGAIKTMVVLSAKASAELFKNNDLSFAERTVTETMRSHGYDKGSLALAPYGPFWRTLRRICTVEMIVNKRINESALVRRKCVDNMLLWIEEEARELGKEARGGGGGGGIQVGRFVFLSSFNLFGNLVLSRDIFDRKSEKGSELFKAMNLLMEWTGHANVADFFPWLKRFDPQGLRRKMDRDLGKALEIASGYVKERVEEKRVGKETERVGKDFLDVILDYKGNGEDGPAKISDNDLNIFILEIFMAGTETTSSTTEWAMTELLLNPDKMTIVKSELASVVGKTRKLEETDIDNLPYLQAVVKETLRMHPPIPFLVPRRAIHDTKFMGYDIPENTQVLVNAWAIGRDPACWDEPMCFKPERFLGSNIDYKGQHFEFIPFGAGRRMCAGVPLGHRVLHLVLGSLLHQFNWEFDGGGGGGGGNSDRVTIDMRETLGVTSRKLVPLKAVPKKCVFI